MKAVAIASCAVFLLLTDFALAEHVIDINNDVTNNVYGNSTNPDGSGPPDAATNDNIINIKSGVTVDGSVFGAHDPTSTGSNISIINNTVNIFNGAVVTDEVYGGYGEGGSTTNTISVKDNVVDVNGGSTDAIYGGMAINKSSSGGDVFSIHNKVNIYNNSTAEVIYGGTADNSQSINSATSSENIVNISESTVDAIAGGMAYSRDGEAKANDNTICINGGTVNGVIAGGYAVSENASAHADNNIIEIKGSPELGNLDWSDAEIYGGYIETSFPGAQYSGNRLDLKTSGLTVKGLYNFQILNFYLPSGLTDGGNMLTVTEEANITGAEIHVGIDGGSSLLKTGDTVVLIDATSGTLVGGPPEGARDDGEGMQGVAFGYIFDIVKDGKMLLARLSGAGPTLKEHTKALSEGWISGLALVNQGADLAAGQGMESAVLASAAASRSTGYGFTAFGTVSGGRLRYNTGSHVDMNSLSLMAGFSLGADLKPGRLTLGAFFEYGNGSYDTYNSFGNSASVHGDGNVHHIGGGVLGRMDFTDTGPGRFYLEASGRAGRAHNEYDNDDMRDARGRKAAYEASSAYHGFHLGAGCILDVTDATSLDLYGKYFWTRLEGDSVRLSTGEKVEFSDTDSNRLRLGGRLYHAVNEHIRPYIGAAWEHEFDGRQRAAINGYALRAPSLRGDVGIGELGFSLTPSADLPLSVDLGVQGYTGKREGVTGSFMLKFEF